MSSGIIIQKKEELTSQDVLKEGAGINSQKRHKELKRVILHDNGQEVVLL
jgi:hypothetical protein